MERIPEWIATIVGRLVLENEALRRALDAQSSANGHQLVPEPSEEPVS